MQQQLALQDQLQAEVEQRLADVHAERIQKLTAKLKSSLQGAKVRYPQERLEQLVASAVRSDHELQLQALGDQLKRLQDDNEHLKLELYIAQKKGASNEEDLASAKDGVVGLEQQVRALKRQVDAASLDLQRAQAARAAAEKDSAICEARAAAAEASLATRTADLQELQARYRQLSDAQQRELQAAQQEAAGCGAELQAAQALWQVRQQELEGELAGCRAAIAEYKSQLEAQQMALVRTQVGRTPADLLPGAWTMLGQVPGARVSLEPALLQASLARVWRVQPRGSHRPLAAAPPPPGVLLRSQGGQEAAAAKPGRGGGPADGVGEGAVRRPGGCLALAAGCWLLAAGLGWCWGGSRTWGSAAVLTGVWRAPDSPGARAQQDADAVLLLAQARAQGAAGGHQRAAGGGGRRGGRGALRAGAGGRRGGQPAGGGAGGRRLAWCHAPGSCRAGRAACHRCVRTSRQPQPPAPPTAAPSAAARRAQELQAQQAEGEAAQRKAAKRGDRVARELEEARGEALARAAEVLELQAQLREQGLRREVEASGWDNQVGGGGAGVVVPVALERAGLGQGWLRARLLRATTASRLSAALPPVPLCPLQMNALRSQLAALAAEADALREQASGAQRQASRDSDERLALELRQQQLKYEQRIQVGGPGGCARPLRPGLRSLSTAAGDLVASLVVGRHASGPC
jgi:hypothetical protein